MTVQPLVLFAERSSHAMTSDPTPPADQGARSPRPESRPAAKRFWREATTAPVAGGHELLLDGRPARTPGRRPLSVPGPAAAEALAAEWNAVEGAIDPARMPLTRLANSSIDGVADRRACMTPIRDGMRVETGLAGSARP